MKSKIAIHKADPNCKVRFTTFSSALDRSQTFYEIDFIGVNEPKSTLTEKRFNELFLVKS